MNVPYLTVCILCAFLGIAFLYRFCLVFRSSREGYETGACKTIGSRETKTMVAQKRRWYNRRK